MNHQKKKSRKFGRKRGPRQAFLKGLANNLILKGRLRTTEARAKSIRPVVERLVTVAKKQNLASFRRLLSILNKPAAAKLYYELAPRFQNRSGGYLRLIRTDSARKRDGAKIAIVEFV